MSNEQMANRAKAEQICNYQFSLGTQSLAGAKFASFRDGLSSQQEMS